MSDADEARAHAERILSNRWHVVHAPSRRIEAEDPGSPFGGFRVVAMINVSPTPLPYRYDHDERDTIDDVIADEIVARMELLRGVKREDFGVISDWMKENGFKPMGEPEEDEGYL